MKKIICSDTGRNAPEEITDRGESIKEVTTLLEEIADKAREARIEEHDEEDKERSKEEDKKNIYMILLMKTGKIKGF